MPKNKIIYNAVKRKTIENNKAANYYVSSYYLRKIWMNNTTCFTIIEKIAIEKMTKVIAT
jgi:hypothetical protein